MFCATIKKIACLGLGVAWLLLNLSYPFQAIAQDQLLQEPYKSKAYLNSYYQAVRYYNSELSDRDTRTIVLAILHYAYEYSLDPRFVMAVIACESGFNPQAVSPAGAIGLGQLMPDTARSVKTNDPYNINLNIRGACYLLKSHLLSYGCRNTLNLSYFPKAMSLTLAAYNAGPRRPKNWRSTLVRTVDGAVFAETIPFTETRDYVKNVMSNATYYAALFEKRPQSLKARLGYVSP